MSRAAVIATLKTKLGPKTSVVYETAIYEFAQRLVALKEKGDSSSITEVYNKIAYEKCGELLGASTPEVRKKILADLRGGVDGWNSCVYEPQREKQAKFNQQLKEPMKLVKGAFYCRDKIKCKSDECYSYSMQCRGNDEGFTTFVICSKCGLRYKFG